MNVLGRRSSLSLGRPDGCWYAAMPIIKNLEWFGNTVLLVQDGILFS